MAAPGSVAYDAEFKADTSQGQQSLRDYQTQIKAVRAEIGKATKEARENYQQQMLAARASGASTETLTEIQQQYAQSQLSIKNTQKQLTDSILQGNYAALESEQALQAVRKQAIATMEAELAAARALASAHSGHTVSGQSAASGAVQLLDGRGGIRTIENFLGNTLGLGGLFTALFPVVGAIQAGKLLYDLGEKVYEVGHKASEAGKLMGEAFDESHAKAQVTIDDLAVQADKIQLNIDKLSGHPSNGLKLALDEARVYADKLQQSLQADRKELDALLKEHQVGAFASILSGVEPTVTQDKQISQDHRDVEAKVAAANAAFNADSANAKSLDDIKRAGEKRDNAIRSAIQGTINTYKAESKRLRDEQTSSAAETAFNLAHGGEASTAVNNSAKIANIEVAQGRYQDYLNTFNAQGNVAALTEKENKLKAAKESSTLANEASRKSIEEQRKRWEQEHNEFELGAERSKADEVNFWQQKLDSVRKGSESYRAALEKFTAAWREMVGETGRLSKENSKLDLANTKIYQEMDSDVSKQFWAEQNQQLAVGARLTTEYVHSLSGLADATTKANQSAAESAINHGLADGTISKLDGAIQLQTLHTTEYTEALNQLQAALANVSGDSLESKTRRSDLNKQIVELNASRSQQMYSDNAAVANSTVAGSLKQANQTWLADTENIAPQITAIYTDIFKGMNSQIADMMTGQKANWSSFFRSIATQLATLGLNQLEAPLANSVQKAAGSGSFFSSLFGGFHAMGGQLTAGRVAVVGERGPEAFIPSTSGTIIPHDRLMGLGGGGNHWNVSVDARGSTNPAEVEAAAHRAVRAAAPDIVAAALATQRDQQSRRPYSQR